MLSEGSSSICAPWKGGSSPAPALPAPLTGESRFLFLEHHQMLTEGSSLTDSVLFRNWAPFPPSAETKAPPRTPFAIRPAFLLLWKSGSASAFEGPAFEESRSWGRGTRTRPRESGRDTAPGLRASPSFYAPHPFFLVRGGNSARPTTRPGRQKSPGPRLVPPSSPSRPEGLRVQPPRSSARAASGELSPGAGGRGAGGQGGGGPGAVAPPAVGRSKPAGPMRRGARRPGDTASATPAPPTAPPRPTPPGFKALQAAGGGAASTEQREEMRQGAASPASCAPRPRWPWPRSACWRCPPPPPPPTSGQCPLRPGSPAFPSSRCSTANFSFPLVAGVGSRTQSLAPVALAAPQGRSSRPDRLLWLPRFGPSSDPLHLRSSPLRCPRPHPAHSIRSRTLARCRLPDPCRRLGPCSGPGVSLGLRYPL